MECSTKSRQTEEEAMHDQVRERQRRAGFTYVDHLESMSPELKRRAMNPRRERQSRARDGANLKFEIAGLPDYSSPLPPEVCLTN
jgi:hypothetical protein